MSTNNRNLALDITKGLSILLVVFGHNWIVLDDKAELYRVIFSFHVPVFLLAAGVFIKEKTSFRQSLVTKADALLKPYFVVLTGLGIGKLVAQPQAAANHFGGMLYANGEVISWVPLWFLPHLFLGFLACWAVMRLAEQLKLNLWLVIPVLWAGGVWVLDKFWEVPVAGLGGPGGPSTVLGRALLPGLPFSADLLPLSCAFMLTGFVLRERLKALRFHPLGFFVALAVFVACHAAFDHGIDLNMRRYDHAAVSSVEIVTGAYLLIQAAAFLSEHRELWVGKALAYIGSASLFILIFHMVVQVRVFDLLARFLPNPYVNGVLSFVVAVAVPVLLYEFVRRVPWLAMCMLPLKSRSRPVSPPAVSAEASAR
jgi:fucose 4-O-acetylase-like acetyltransferase